MRWVPSVGADRCICQPFAVRYNLRVTGLPTVCSMPVTPGPRDAREVGPVTSVVVRDRDGPLGGDHVGRALPFAERPQLGKLG